MRDQHFFNKLKSLKGSSSPKEIQTNNISLNISHSQIPNTAFDILDEITKDISIIETFQSFFHQNTHNTTEKESINHHHLRSNKNNNYTKEKNRLLEFIKTFHLTNNNKITDVVQIGIGGSYLGPKILYETLCYQSINSKSSPTLKGHFITNIDPIDFKSCTKNLNPNSTLFILASKSGNTMEIKTNITLLKEWWKNHGLPNETLIKQCIVLTKKYSELDTPSISNHRFYIDNPIGGRFSTTSVVGLCLIGLCFGNTIITEILEGAHFMDKNALQKSCNQNLSLTAAWEHIWQRNIKNYPSRAIIAYSYALQSFPLFAQQLTCESNGKSVDKNGSPLTYKTAPIITTGTGTNAQHSFFQLLHQGTDIIPIEFIGIKNQNTLLTTPSEKQSHTLLNANMYAQIKALFEGEKSENKRYHFEGKRPSTLILLETLTPFSLGQLIAYYENKTLFEGLIWDINSFDQIGVQLGKKLANPTL